MFSLISLVDLEDDSESSNDDQRNTRVRRRQLRDSTNILELSDAEFQENFRVNKVVFLYIFDEIKPYMRKTYRNTALPPKLKLAAFLRFLATGSYQKCLAIQSMSLMSESTISKLISECLEIFENHFCQKWVKFNRTPDEENIAKEHFHNEYGFPGIVGCIGGTHVRIKSPGENTKHLYYNNEGFYSINAMVICDHNMIIRYVDARSPGANHHAFIWKNSVAERQLELAFNNGKLNTWLIGDSGFPLQPYLMTPFGNPTNISQRRYNERHIKARIVVERCFGVLKNRFRCILGSKPLQYSPQKATSVINVCCALHNVCISYKNYWPPPDNISVTDVEGEDLNTDVCDAAEEIRRQLALNQLLNPQQWVVMET